MTPFSTKKRRARALLAAVALVIAVPASTMGAAGYRTLEPAYVAFTSAVVGGELVPLINSGEDPFGLPFEGLPDGLGVVPGPPGSGYVDMYVAHEQSHVPFGLGADSVFADFQDSSVTRIRVDLATQSIIEMDTALPASAGFIRFCSAFMAGPEHGFADYTFFVNEESNDNLPVPAGAVYGADPSMGGQRDAGYSVWLNTATGEFDVISRAGRHNHENSVVVPGGWNKIAMLSGDDTFSAPSSQLYLYLANNADQVMNDKGQLFAFQVTADDDGPVNPNDPFNNANDYLEINPDETWSGRFIHVPTDVARGTTAEEPQAALENWSNANNVFQFVRVEDLAYDPDNPRVVYFADTGTDRLLESDVTGRLYRGARGTGVATSGRIFKMVLNERDPRIVDEFSILLEGSSIGMRNPDNIEVGHDSLMVQEDTSDAKIWMHSLATGDWTHVATATWTPAETTGIIDVSEWFGSGWWALDVQQHEVSVGDLDPTSEVRADWYTWPLFIPGGQQYRYHREDGQLLLMHIPGS